jgi:hypothetical protein
MRSLEEDPVLDRDRVQLAGAHADEGEGSRRSRRRGENDAVGVALRLPERQRRRMEVLLPGLRADHVAEQGAVGAPREAIVSGRMLVRPARREIVRRIDAVVDDDPVAHGRPVGVVALAVERA